MIPIKQLQNIKNCCFDKNSTSMNIQIICSCVCGGLFFVLKLFVRRVKT